MLGDYEEALAWLEYVERQEGTLTDDLTELRRTWVELDKTSTGA